MAVKAVGILSPGDMGSAVGQVLHEHGLGVVTCLEGRSQLSHLRAKEAGFRTVPSLDDLVRQVDVLLSILVPAEAVKLAERVAERLRAAGARLVYADFNAIAPQTTKQIGTIIEAAGSQFVDGGIIGNPPRSGAKTRFYCSGPDVSAVMELGQFGLDVRTLGDVIGHASGLKMVYAASTKGTTALWTELLTAAKVMGLSDALACELAESRVYAPIKAGIPTMPRRSRRWVGEMEEIAKTFDNLGLTPKMLLGAADMYRLVGRTPLGARSERDPNPSFEETIETVVKELMEGQPHP